MNAHTPGPFFLAHAQGDERHPETWSIGTKVPNNRTQPASEDTLYIARVFGRNKKEIKANGDLFAAAPDLLAVLEEIGDMGVERADLVVAQDGPAEEVIRWRDLEPLLTVIAKAGGVS